MPNLKHWAKTDSEVHKKNIIRKPNKENAFGCNI